MVTHRGRPAGDRHRRGRAVDLLDAVARMLRLLDHPTDAPVLAPLVEREILWRLLTGPHGGMVRQIGLTDSGLSHVSRAIRWIRDNYAEPMRIADLAGLAGMSPSAFHRHFRDVTTMSPLQFQKRIRLQEARSLLLARTRRRRRASGTSSATTAPRSSAASTAACSVPHPVGTPRVCARTPPRRTSNTCPETYVRWRHPVATQRSPCRNTGGTFAAPDRAPGRGRGTVGAP